MELINITEEKLAEAVMQYIRENYSYKRADIIGGEIQLTDENDNVVCIYINVEGEDE